MKNKINEFFHLFYNFKIKKENKMSNNTGLIPYNGHRIQGRSSESFINARDVISRLNLKGNEVFMDAGCGDGHTAMEAYEMMDDDATIYALDIYDPSIEDIKIEVIEKKINNLIPIQGDIAGNIPLPNDKVDMTLMINVFHGFVAQQNFNESISELKRITKPGGKIAIMDYKKMKAKNGPPYAVRSSPEEIEAMFARHGLKMIQLDNDAGENLGSDQSSHYLIILEK